jgi:hypothetical protein
MSGSIHHLPQTGENQMAESANGSEKPMVLLDLGKKRRKQIKRLRKGRGRLMQQVDETVAQLKEEEAIDPNSQVVVVVVKEKKKSRGWW